MQVLATIHSAFVQRARRKNVTLKQMHRFLSRLRMERKNPKNDGEFVPPQHEISGDGSFDFGDDNGEGNGHNNGRGRRRRNRDGESGDDFNWPSGRINLSWYQSEKMIAQHINLHRKRGVGPWLDGTVLSS